MVKVKDLKKGDYFTLKDIKNPTESQVYVRGEYIREEKKYSCYKFSDINAERLFVGEKLVFTDFIF